MFGNVQPEVSVYKASRYSYLKARVDFLTISAVRSRGLETLHTLSIRPSYLWFITMKWWYLTALLATALAAPLTVDPGTSNANALEALFKAGTELIETQDVKASVIQTTYNERT